MSQLPTNGPESDHGHAEEKTGAREWITINQMADLVQKEPKTIYNEKIVKWLDPVTKGLWRYADARRALLAQWPEMAHRLPESYSDAMNLLPPCDELVD